MGAPVPGWGAMPPRPTPALDALTHRLTAFLALLTTAAGYRPHICLDRLARDALMLARACDLA